MNKARPPDVKHAVNIRRLVRRLASLFRSRREDADLTREIRSHLQWLEDTFAARGMSREEAQYGARRAFGGIERAKELHRDARAARWLDSCWLELKLGARLLLKHPGLTIVGSCAMAFGIAFGATVFEARQQIVNPTIPLDDANRLVAIRLRDAATAQIERRVAHDFMTWRAELDAVEQIGAFRIVERNLTPEGGSTEPASIAEMTIDAFRVARVQPWLGRPLTPDDEVPGAPLVAVIGYDLWRTRFAGDPNVIGRVVQLGASRPTIVGVMPEGFGFPFAEDVWMPLRLRPGEHPARSGPALTVIGRLAAGVHLTDAQAALTHLGRLAATASPATHTHLRPEIVPYASSFVPADVALGFTLANAFVVMFLLLVCANVGALVFARAMTRHAEITVRSALGATRGRIVMQLFIEALVLGGVAAVIGLAGSRSALQWLFSVRDADAVTRPFWMHPDLSPATIVYTGGLTILCAIVAGVMPAMKLTGGRLESRLRRSTLGDSSLTFGRTWMAVVAAQVAATTAFPATAFLIRQGVLAMQSFDAGFPAGQYLSARLELDGDDMSAPPTARDQGRLRNTLEELQRRLSSESLLSGVTFSDRLPRTVHPERLVELEPLGGDVPSETSPERVRYASVAANYFDVLGAPMLVGRSFRPSDVTSVSRVVVVNRSFVDRVAGGRNPVGRRVRYAATRGEPATAWHEIVGVVKDLAMIHDDTRNGAGIYHPAAPHDLTTVHVALHVKADPAGFGPRLRSIAASVDPSLRVHEVLPLDAVGAGLWNEFDALWRVLGIGSTIALLLSLAGIYAMMSSTVSRRTREIGIRVALGATRWSVTAAIAVRTLAPVSVGLVGGGLLVFAMTKVLAALSLREVAGVVVYVVIMAGVCLLACVVPVRRALRVQPTEALRAE